LAVRIAILCFGTTGHGGMETVMATLLRQFEADGDVATLFLLGGSQDQAWLEGVPAKVLGSPHDSKIARYLRYIFQLPFALRAFRPDLILCADPRSIFVASAIRRVFGVKVKIASWVHFTLDRLRHTRFLRLADVHFAISSAVAEGISRRGLHPVHIIYNPVAVSGTWLPRAQIPTFLYVGRVMIAGPKRTDDFLRALAALNGTFRAVVIGGGPHEAALKELSSSLGLADKVSWLGWQTRPWDVAPPCSALVMTSEYEGFGMVLAEAITKGLPCVSTDCTGPSDIIVPSKNGWLVPVGNIGQLSDCLQRIIDDPSILPTASSVASTSSRFSAPRITDAMRKALTPA
jgi:UDP-D-galactose:(glucosyl)LPS alpha-1,6-D-galactosyltransferase